MTATILVIEDNPITSRLVRHTLETEHHDVQIAPDGATGLALVRARRPALILLDLLLPDGDGFALFHELRALANAADVPILACSGILSAEDDARLAAVGFDGVITKPIEPPRLLQIVRAHLPPVDALAERAPPTAAVRTLVLADDDAVQRKLVALRLQRAGFHVTTAADGQEAFDRARAVRPYAIVSDVLMPRLDGFGLCMAVRNDPVLAQTPVLLISNSYLDTEDRTLARRSGADELLVRTPELDDVVAVLRSDLATRRMNHAAPAGLDPRLEHEHLCRALNQLERQVAQQAGLTQRCSLLSAELSVLSGISEAVATEHDIEGALHQILAMCFDAAGIALGALYLIGPDGMRAIPFGAIERCASADLAAFFGHRELLDSAMATQALICVPSPGFPEHRYRTLFERTGARSVLIAPLGHKGQALGALVTMSASLDAPPQDRIAFAQAVAGQVSLAVALARSFQAKDASERSARSNARVLRSILDSMAEGVLVSDEHGALTHSNHAASKILRAPPEALPIAVRERPELPLLRALRGESIDGVETCLHDRGGAESTWLSVSARPLVDDANSVHGAVAVFRDVTAEKAANARMLVSERMASLGTLAAGVGHEINNPLMAALGNLDMALNDLRKLRRELGDRVDLNELAEELRDAREAAERVRAIVLDLKVFSRSDRETRGPVRVEDALESSIRMVWNEIRYRAELVRDFKPVPPVYANASRLGQVFMNLIMNAAQAIPEGRAADHAIRVATSLAGDGRVRIEISDTGSGMPPDVLAKIFTPFFTTKPIGVGTGLGLAICHQLVTAAGGEILVDTKLGVGTTFSVVLPAMAGEARIAEPAVPDLAPACRRGRILVVDDELIVTSTIQRALGKEHDVTGLVDPLEAVRQIGNGQSFDVILCDLMMPKVTGMELYETLAKLAPDQASRMIFITGGVCTDQGRAFLDSTRHAYIEKPVDLDALRALVAARIRAADNGRHHEHA
jgi:DNA-binding response OmpR family regulator/signal transduction histidine kinase